MHVANIRLDKRLYSTLFCAKPVKVAKANARFPSPKEIVRSAYRQALTAANNLRLPFVPFMFLCMLCRGSVWHIWRRCPVAMVGLWFARLLLFFSLLDASLCNVVHS